MATHLQTEEAKTILSFDQQRALLIDCCLLSKSPFLAQNVWPIFLLAIILIFFLNLSQIWPANLGDVNRGL